MSWRRTGDPGREALAAELAALARQAANPVRQMTRQGGNTFAPACPAPSTYEVSGSETLAVGLAGGRTQSLPLSEHTRRDTSPIPASIDREGYGGEDHRHYWESGLTDLVKVRDAADRLLGDRPLALLDLGCSSGRFVRHVAAQAPSWPALACDIDAMHVRWVKAFLPRTILAFQNTVYPHLPLPDGSLDVVTAFSVFTHIDQLEDAWLLEIRRVLRPGGLLYLSAHTERVWSRVPTRPGMQAILLECLPEWSEPRGIEVSPASFGAPMPGEHLVLRFQDGGAYGAQVFHSERHIRQNWGRLLDVVEIHDGYHIGFQDVVVLRKSG